MNRIIGRTGLLLLAAGFVALSTFSCRKKGETVAKIIVVDTSGAAFPGAMVRLYPSPTVEEHGAITIDDTMFSDATGTATFNFTENYNLGQAGVFVLDIEVRSGDSLFTDGIIKVEQEVTSTETVVIQ